MKKIIVAGMLASASLVAVPTVALASADKVLVCHATGSESNPTALLEVSASGADGEGANDHTQHPGDKIEGRDGDADAIRAACATTVEVTVPGPTVTSTVTGPTATVTENVPGPTVTSTVTEPPTTVTETVTPEPVTNTVTLPVETRTVQVPGGQQVVTVHEPDTTVTQTMPGNEATEITGEGKVLAYTGIPLGMILLIIAILAVGGLAATYSASRMRRH